MSHSRTVPNPDGGAAAGRGLMQPTLHDQLMERIVAPDNMHRAWRRVKANKGKPGSDGLPLEDFPAFAREHWAAIREQLLDGSYRPQPVRRAFIAKRSGAGQRPLGIPNVLDRLIQQAIAQVLGPIFDPGFSAWSFGFRPHCSAHGALRQVQAYVKAGFRIAVDLDLAKFFDNVDHDILMARVAAKVRDKKLLALIGAYLRAGAMVGEEFEPSELGTRETSAVSLRTQLGGLDGTAPGQACAVRARLDGLLRHLAVLPTDPRARRVAAPARAHVLLETVAPPAYQGAAPVGPGDGLASGHRCGDEPQGLLALGPLGHASGYEQRVAEAAGVNQYPRPVDAGAGIHLGWSRAPRS